mgnify:CR=1 FL=1
MDLHIFFYLSVMCIDATVYHRLIVFHGSFRIAVNHNLLPVMSDKRALNKICGPSQSDLRHTIFCPYK